MDAATALGRTPAPVASTRRAGPYPQRPVVAAAASVLVVGAAGLGASYGPRHATLFLIGAGCGLALYHAAFGFASAFRALVTVGDGRGVRAQLLMFAVATLLFAPFLAIGRGVGIPLDGAVAPAGASVIVGAFMFAVGMQLGGGCGSGTLFHLGSGRTPLAATLAGFVAGSVIATFHMPFWWSAPALDDIALGRVLGWGPAVALQLLVLALLAAATRWVERRRAGTRPAPPVPLRARLVRGPWPLAAGAVALAVLNTLTLATAGHPWSITWAFTLWGGKLLQAGGYDLSAVAFWRAPFPQAALRASVLADVTSIMNLGVVLGAALAAGLAGRFAPTSRVRARNVATALLGGLLLGYGARIAYGCNIGALFSGIASTSLHGWLWGAAALAGTPLGVRLRTLLGDEPRS